MGGQQVGVSTRKEMLMIVGVWARLPEPDQFLVENRKLEHKVRELDGMKGLYAHCRYTKEEFWHIYDKKWYDELRAKYHATSLPSVYDKTWVDWDVEQRATRESWLRWLSGGFGRS